MISTKLLGTGTLIFVAGVGALFSHNAGLVSNPAIYTLGMSMGLLGLVLTVLGLFPLLGSALIPKKGIHNQDSAAFSVGLIRCMLAISISDNHLDDDEIVQISKIYKHLTSADIEESTIRDIAAEMQQYGIDIKRELETITPTLNNALREKLIIASLFILTADGAMEEDELIMLDDIRLGVGLSLRQLERIKKDSMKNQKVEIAG